MMREHGHPMMMCIRQRRRRASPSRVFSHCCCGLENGGHDRSIPCAPANVAGKHVADLLLVGMGRLSQEMSHGTKYAGSTEPALQGVMFRECALHLIERAGLGEPLHGYDLRAVYLRRVLSAAAHCSPIDQDRTGSADPVLTADMNTEGLELMT